MDGWCLLESFFFEQLLSKCESDGDDMFLEFCCVIDEDGFCYLDCEVVDYMIFLLMVVYDMMMSLLSLIVLYFVWMLEFQERLCVEVIVKVLDLMIYEECDGFDFCDWMFKEVLCMYLLVLFIGCCIVCDVVVGGVEIFVFILVSICLFVIYQFEELWMLLCSFDFECFLLECVEDKQYSYVYFFFGGGVYMCIGMYFVGFQVKVFFVQFFKKYCVFVLQGYVLVMILILIFWLKDGLLVWFEWIG